MSPALADLPVTLRLYNTQARAKERFEPLDPDHVRMYVCGPTVYDRAHIGNARPVIVFDVLYRLLKRLYPRVTYVRNITDIDDKIIAAADQGEESIPELTERFTKAFHEDMAPLGALDPDHEPRATDYIPHMVAMIEALLDRGNAYEAEGHVLFHIASMDDYGALSHRSPDDMIAGARVEVAPYKKHPADFVLWKPSAPELPGWDSPWGRGRPGWHLECSAMSKELLGTTFDIHGGGQDLIFPHHENERAQSICAHDGAPFANYWVHNGHLIVEGEKMSKSLGNFVTVRDLLKKAPGEAIRYNMLGTHYRQPADWTEAGLRGAKDILDSFYQALAEVADLDVEAATDLPNGIQQALEDDLNTPAVRGPLRDISRELNTTTNRADKARLKSDLLVAGNALGLLQQTPEEWFRWKPVGAIDIDEREIDAMVTARDTARTEGDFARADQIREELRMTFDVILEDGADGTRWKRVR